MVGNIMVWKYLSLAHYRIRNFSHSSDTAFPSTTVYSLGRYEQRVNDHACTNRTRISMFILSRKMAVHTGIPRIVSIFLCCRHHQASAVVLLCVLLGAVPMGVCAPFLVPGGFAFMAGAAGATFFSREPSTSLSAQRDDWQFSLSA